MIKPTLPANEEERLAALRGYHILDTLPEELYDDLTEIASQICRTPISLISLLDDKRQWFKSHHGLEVTETPKDLAYCAHAINSPNEILEVPDAFEDERFHDNPLATGSPHVRFYAGAPLTTRDGHTLGTICVIDHQRRKLDSHQRKALMALSRQVVALLEARRENLQHIKFEGDLTTLLENLGDGVFELDGEGKGTFANGRMLEMLNRTMEEMLSQSIWDLIYSEDVDAMKAFYNSQFKNQVAQCYYEYRLTKKGGDPFWVGQSTTMEYKDGRMIRLRSIARDLTENKRLKEKLELKESLFKLVSENSTDLIALHEPDGTYKFMTPSSRDLIGYQPSELIGTDPYQLFHPDDQDMIRSGLHQKTLEGISVEQVEYRIRRKDGTYIWFETYSKPLFDDLGKVISIQTSSREITGRKKEQQDLKLAKVIAEEATQAKASFLSMMSHEIRTPLNGIVGVTHLLLNKGPKKEQRTYLEILKQSGDSLMAIVNDILDFEKIEEGKLKLDYAPFNLNHTISSIHKNYTTQAAEKGVDVNLSFDEKLSANYIGDSVRLNQILHNLMNNAVKFTEIGSVSLSLSRARHHKNFDEILIEVQDTGVGIAVEKHKKIFDEFVQSDRTTTRNYGGSGLGLSITKRLLELMESEIHLVSSLGNGSNFSFRLILARHKGELFEQDIGTETVYEPLNAKVLLVEDNKFNMVIIRDFLESWNCTVIEAINGKEALQVLEAEPVDLMLLDLQMPVMDGYETIKEIRQKEGPLRWLPVIALTAAALGEDRNKVFQSGMDDILMKPFLPAEFHLKLKTILSRVFPEPSDLLVHLREKLRATLGKDGDVDKYLSIFSETLAAESDFLMESISSKNLINLKKYAHKNKSSFEIVGLLNLAQMAKEIEDSISRESPTAMIFEKARNHRQVVNEVLLKLNSRK